MKCVALKALTKENSMMKISVNENLLKQLNVKN